MGGRSFLGGLFRMTAFSDGSAPDATPLLATGSSPAALLAPRLYISLKFCLHLSRVHDRS